MSVAHSMGQAEVEEELYITITLQITTVATVTAFDYVRRGTDTRLQLTCERPIGTTWQLQAPLTPAMSNQ